VLFATTSKVARDGSGELEPWRVWRRIVLDGGTLRAFAVALWYCCGSFAAAGAFTRQGSQVRTLHRPPKQ
jgi:hypothetical protein